jgi:hypothetical protein
MNTKLLTFQIKGSNTQFSTPLYLPPGQKKSGVSGHILFLLWWGSGAGIAFYVLRKIAGLNRDMRVNG